MDFLKNAVSKVGGYLGDIFNRGNANLAGLFNSTNLGNSPLSPKPQTGSISEKINTIADQQFIANNGKVNSTPVPANIKYSSFGGPTTIQSQQNYNQTQRIKEALANLPSSNAAPAYTPYSQPTSSTPYEIGNYRSSLPQVTGGQDIRKSTADQGVPYIDESGKLIIPKAGFSGQSGDGGSGLTFATPQTGTTGFQGGGGSAYTGLLSGVSGLGSPSAITSESSDEQGNKKKFTLTAPKNYLDQPAPTLPGVNPSASFVAPSQQLNIKPSSTIDLGQMNNMQKASSDVGSNIGTNDFESFKEQFSTAYNTALSDINSKNVLPDNLTQDTTEQLAAIQQSEDPFGYRQAVDQFKSSQTNLDSLYKEQVDNLKQIQAANQAFTTIVSDVKNNPDLPKGLAMRRINEVQKTQKTKIDELLGSADIIKAQIDNQNELVNRNFKIATEAKNDNDKTKERDMAKFKLFVDTGAIGAFTDADIKKYASITGLSTSVISKMKSSAKDPNVDIYTTTDDKGTVRGIDKKTGKTIWTQTGAGGTKTVSQPDIKEFQGQYATFANRLEQSIPILFDTLAPTITNMNAAQLQGYVTANDISPILANRATPDNVKSYIQASRDLINAVLRKESGAVISPSEFATARGQYLPMPGDNAQALAQKRTSAMANLNNFKNAAGGAYVPSIAVPVQGASTGTGTQFKGSSGKTYNLPY